MRLKSVSQRREHIQCVQGGGQLLITLIGRWIGSPGKLYGKWKWPRQGGSQGPPTTRCNIIDNDRRQRK